MCPKLHVLALTAVLAVLAGCTPGASGGGGAAPVTATSQTVDINLTQYGSPTITTAAGPAAGYAPIPLTVAVGTTIHFVNTDGFAHTATSISSPSFPSTYPFTSNALNASGSSLSGSWSTGALNAGDASQTFIADRAGTYIFGCFFHYGAPMRGEIVVQ